MSALTFLKNIVRLGALGLILGFGTPAWSQDFYKDKTINLVISSGTGGGYDTYARFLGRHIVRHIPGNPRIIPKNMPGAGGMIALNYAYTTAPQDGTVIFTLHQNLPMYQRMGAKGVQYDARKIHGIGRLSAGNEILFADARSGVKGYKDLYDREVVIGGTGAGSVTVIYPTLARDLLDLRFKVVSGYKSATETKLAMERGEVQAMMFALGSVYTAAPEFLRPGKTVALIQYGLKREQEFPDAPLAHEIAKSEEVRKALEALSVGVAIGRSYWLGPGVPKERIQILRTAFNEMIRDEKALKEFKDQGMMARFATGEEIDGYIRRVFAAPEAAVELLRKSIPGLN